MLYNLEPSSELSGGAWYSDTELDEAFIEAISNACLRSIQERVLASQLHLDRLILSTLLSRRLRGRIAITITPRPTELKTLPASSLPPMTRSQNRILILPRAGKLDLGNARTRYPFSSPQVYTNHDDGTSTSSGLHGYPNSDPSNGR
ncbi:unnamed protein product [Tilletia caries]|nr:unnamed protein product [Tilletia caries]